MSALLFGSISTLADTSELQRESFNEAFAAHDLDWRWDQDDYREMLRGNGGADRIAGYAAERGQDVDAAAVHATKSELFQQKLGRGGLTARPGVLESLRSAKTAGAKVALVTTTSPENVVALVQGVDELSLEDFDLVVDNSVVTESKPDPAAYAYALRTLGEDAADAVAVEDNVGGVESANAAGVTVLAFPNTNTASHDFSAASRVVDRLDPAQLPAGLQA
ncbi:HAD family phosphatase [Modestobacter sp. Leaf380]|uniref:HAD family hydrolase n=1 Tax=Modestobacter sp. Leaf380 TaxID=1736356 RepID=UPI0006FFEDE2|nr:HAD-IA family hydrolase [Modestobacter sp. Leaf380]KQS71164.1 haloacid dehalogenase [Modestobacter sp. Leaf380]